MQKRPLAERVFDWLAVAFVVIGLLWVTGMMVAFFGALVGLW